MKLGDWLKTYREQHDLSMQELADLCGFSKAYINILEKGVNPKTKKPVSPTIQTFEKIARGTNTNVDTLLKILDGDQPITLGTAPDLDDLPSPPAKDVTFPLNDTHRVPIIGTVRCGPGGLAYEHIDEYMTIDASYNPDEMRGFRAEGDSMIGDGIYDGDLCLICLQPEVENGAIAVVVIDGEEGCLKHITVDKTNGVVVLSSSNPAYPQRIFTGASANDVRIVGKLIEVRHRF